MVSVGLLGLKCRNRYWSTRGKMYPTHSVGLEADSKKLGDE